MANLIPASTFSNVRQFETTDLVLAGPGQTMNEQAQALLNRTEYLSDAQIAKASQIAALEDFDSDLQDDGGSNLVGFIQEGADAVGYSVRDKISQTVSVLDFMTDAERSDTLLDTPLLDHQPAMQKALNFAASTNSGTRKRTRRVYLPTNGRNYVINGADLTVPIGVTLCTDRGNIDRYLAANFLLESGSILLNPLRTIHINSTSALEGIVVLPLGMAFPQYAADVATWTGTAVTVSGSATKLENCAFIGFEYALDWNSSSPPTGGRHRWNNVLFDCHKACRQGQNLDSCYFSNLHGWPAASSGASGLVADDLTRPGPFWDFNGHSDYQYFTNCFAYGYLAGFFKWSAFSTARFIQCDADGPSPASFPGYVRAQKGWVYNVASGARLISCSAAQCATAIELNHTGAGQSTMTVIGLTSFQNTKHFDFIGGGADISESKFTGGEIAVDIGASANADYIYLDNNQFFQQTVRAINSSNLGSKLQIVVSPNNKADASIPQVMNQISLPNVTAASATRIPRFADLFQVSGASTNINSFDANDAMMGKVITVLFSTAQTLVHSANLVLKGGINAAPGVGQLMTFAPTATGVYREASRSF